MALAPEHNGEKNGLRRTVEQAPTLPRLQVLKGLRVWLIEGCFASVNGTLVGGAFQTGFALYIGCTSFEFGLLAAIPAIVGLLQLPASYYAERFATRKQVVMAPSLAGRLCWLPILLIPWLVPRHLWVVSFLALLFLSSALMNISVPSWTSWITDLAPPDNRGSYFGRRNMLAGITGMFVSIVAGWFLDHVVHVSHWSQPLAFAALFALACIAAFGSYFLARSSPDLPRSKPVNDRGNFGELLESLRTPFNDRAFRRIIVFFVVMAVAQSIAGQFFVNYSISYLRLDYTMLQILNSVAALVGLLTMPIFGYLADKYGNKPVLEISCFLVLFAPIIWCLTSADHYAGFYTVGDHGQLIISSSKLWIVLLNFLSGAGWSGVGLTQFNIMIGSAPADKRTAYVSIIAATVGLASAIGPLVGGTILGSLAHVRFPASGLVRSNYHVLFLICAGFRLMAFGLSHSLDEPESRSMRYVLGQLRSTNPVSSFTAVQRLSRGSSSGRRRAAEKLGQLKAPVAVEELVVALDDVSLPVREQAANALGEIGDSRAVSSLVSKLADPASGITQEAAVALGKIGDRGALPALAAAAELEGPASRRIAAIEAIGQLSGDRATNILLTFVADPDAAVRLATVRAIAEDEARLRDRDVSNALLTQWEQEDDAAVLSMILEALSASARPEIADRLFAKYDLVGSRIYKRGIVNAVAGLIAGRDSFYAYLMLDPFARDETVTKILYSVGRQFTGRKLAQPAGEGLRAVLASYAEQNYPGCIDGLMEVIDVLAMKDPDNPASMAILLIRMLKQRSDAGEETSAEDVLLGIFLLRYAVGVSLT